MSPLTSLSCLAPPFIGAALLVIPPLRRFYLAIFLVASSAAAALSLVPALLVGPGAPIYLVEHLLVVDATASVFLPLVNVLFAGIAVYTVGRVRIGSLSDSHIERFVALAMLFLVAVDIAILANHLMLTWAALEASTLAATPLVIHNQTGDALRAGWRYLLFSMVGLALTLLGFLCVARGLETAAPGPEVAFFVDELAQRPYVGEELWRQTGLLLIVLGYGTKLGLAPMYAWLPITYDMAPPTVTALLAAVQFNGVLCALLRVLEAFHATRERVVRSELIVLGLFTLVVSALQIVSATNFKRLVSYASMNHAGVIAIGLGVGKQAVYGAVLYTVSNALVKAMLFQAAGNIKTRYRTKTIAGLSGIIKDMPYSGLFFMCGTFALLGFAPFGSFWGEMLILSACVRAGHIIIFVAACLMLTVTFVAVGRSLFPMIWGEPRGTPDGQRETALTLAPGFFFLGVLMLLGVYLPPPLERLFQQVAISLGGTP